MSPPQQQLSIGFLLLPRFTLTPLAAMVDVLRLAADAGDRSRPIRCRWDIVSETGRPIVASCGVAVEPTASLKTDPAFDYVAVVGGVMQDAPRLSDAERDYLRRAARDGTPLIGVCTGVFELLNVGLLDRRRCCVSWFHVADLLNQFPDTVPVADKLFVDDGDRITCAGGAGAADLAAHLVERHCSLNKALKALRILQVDHGVAEDGSQPSPRIDLPPIKSERVARAMLLMEQHIAEPVSIADIASALHVSTRQLHRDFTAELGMSPGEAKISLQLEYARMRLAASNTSITRIAQVCGFSDSAHFSRRFREKYAQRPSEYRAQIQQRAR